MTSSCGGEPFITMLGLKRSIGMWRPIFVFSRASESSVVNRVG